MSKTARPGKLASTLERGMRVLSLFRENHHPLSLSEIAVRAGLERSAAQRLSYTLHSLGYLERDESTRRYRPGMRMLDLAYAYLIHDRLLERATPMLVEASRALGTTVNLSVLDGHEIIYKARIPHSSLAYDATLIGVRQPAVVTAAGLVIFAFLPDSVLEETLAQGMPAPVTPSTLRDPELVRARVARAREDGYTISMDQLLVQEIVVAAPILGPGRSAIAAVSMPVYKPDWDEERAREEIVPVITETTRTISSAFLHL
ncbi:IclR family transcriptional regulator [Aquibaculum arenosum]|uniref:IclR family transcriptional regulator n=1 Tax=Aquibaculum arenosum TaxID=3032591 RepID=A0ABT5YM97_9PROT|nr:IclR family transcriptional regulator [Fodinicurvata sp. CAU 1616]MDF2095394.1 IclR family transcriptional regulator [Fodinicurvata sp. CAU 1616]